MGQKTKLGYILAYKDPGYVRTRSLIAAIKTIDSIELHTVINRIRNPLRYLEVLLRLVWLRISRRPHIYFLGFRGHEILLPVRILTWPKPLIFDEFFDPLDWIFHEHKKLSDRSPLGRFGAWYYRLPLKSVKIVTDTNSNARHSEKSHGLDKNSIDVISVGTDESVFKSKASHNYAHNKNLQLFFYTNGQKLHGTEYILEAIRNIEGVELHLVGGKEKVKKMIERYKVHDRVVHQDWLDFERLPEAIAAADVCLGGPFGGTRQAHRVITGKTYQFLAMAKPTIIGEIDEKSLFKNKKDCIMVAQHSSRELARAITWAKDNRSQLAAMGNEGRKLFEKKFSRDAIAQQFEKIVQEAISS